VDSTFTLSAAGNYTFGVNSDDGVRLKINAQVVVIDDSNHAARDAFGTVTLAAGTHTFEVVYYENGGGANLEIFIAQGTQTSFNSGFQLLTENPDFNINPTSPALIGQWSELIDWPLVPVSMASLPDGRLLTYSGSERRSWPVTEQAYSTTWDPASGLFDETLSIGHNLFCGALSMTADGKVFVNGGRNKSNSPWTSTYDYESSSWVQIENMATGGRWYPTTLALGDGSIFTALGTSTNARNPEIWSEDEGWRVLNGIDFLDMRQNLNGIGGTNWWPLLTQAPNGSIYHFWDTVENHFITTAGNGNATATVVDTDSSSYAGGVQTTYDEGKLLVAGRTQGAWGPARETAYTVDLNGSAPVLRTTGSMKYKRNSLNLVVLPTGEVVALGGNFPGGAFTDRGTVYTTEIWNPATGSWRESAQQSNPRNYHSTALLLADGRVISAGGGYHPSDANHPATHADAQVFSPPYLFAADGQLANRPSVQPDFSEIGYGQTFGVSTSGNIDYFSLIKLSAVTHSTNTDARFFKPQFSAAGNGRYAITMHSNSNVATPGYWMLFAVDNNGVPSEAEIIQITLEPDDPTNGEPPEVDDIISTPQQAGIDATFTANATGVGLQYSWNFGDGSGDTPFSVNNSVTHNFNQPGRYIVTVTVLALNEQTTVESFTQIVYGNLTATSPVASTGIIEIASRNEVWSVNPDNNSVGVINTSTRELKRVVQVGMNPRALALAPNGQVWVVNKTDASISIVNPSNGSIVQTVSLDAGSQPHGIVFSAHSAYVALEGLSSIVQLNAANGNQRRRKFAGEFPRHLSLNASADRLFVSSFITPPVPGEQGADPDVSGRGGEVRLFSTSASSLTPIKTIVLAHSNRPITESQGPGLPNYLGPAVISPDGTSAWVPSKQDNILGGMLRSGNPLTFDQSVRAITSRIDLSTETEQLFARVDHDNASVSSNAVFGPYGMTLFVSLEGNRQVAMIDTASNIEYARFDVGRAPQSLELSVDGQTLYVHNFLDRTVGIYDVSEVVLRGAADVQELGVVQVAAGELLAANVLQGKKLFYDARDDRLAALDYMSCASCHNESGQDGRVWDFTQFGEGVRNTISLNGPAGTDQGLMHWSGNFDEVQDFEGQIRGFAGGSGLLPNSVFLQGTRREPLGDSKAGLGADLDALAAYVMSLDTAPPSPYRAENGGLTSDAQAGKALFASEGCASCHTGSAFTDSSNAPLLHDIGSLQSASGQRLGGNLAGIDTPSLLGAWSSAPYLHDGSALTLEAAISAHNGVNLSSADLARMASFVAQLDAGDVGTGCTEPAIDAGTDRALFVWQDCSGAVNVLGAGGNQSANYAGVIVSSQSLSNLQLNSIESGDSVANNPSEQINFDITLGGIYSDEFRFDVASGASLCLSLSQQAVGSVILAGAERTLVTSPFDPMTLQSCSLPGEPGCGTPDVNPESDAGVFVWKDCSGPWNVMATGESGSGTISVAGAIASDAGFVSLEPVTMESTDTLTAESSVRAAFNLTTAYPWEDRFEVNVVPDDTLCMALNSLPAGYSVFVGPNKTAVSGSFNPATLESCVLPVSSCQAPVFDAATERALFSWIDCSGSLHLVGTGAAAGASYSGHVYADADFQSVTENSLENSDTLDLVQPNAAYFEMVMGGPWIDEVIITPASNSAMCVDIGARTAGTGLLAGPSRIPVTSPFNPETLESCTPNSEPGCGDPLVDAATDSGLYVWKDCAGTWTLMVTGSPDAGGVGYTGSISASTGFESITPVSIEPSDTLGSNLTGVLGFDLTTGYPWEDRFRFRVSDGADICIALTDMPDGVGRFAGPDRIAVPVSFNPETMLACTL